MPDMRKQQIETPTDQFGRVDGPALVRNVKRFVVPGFQWSQVKGKDVHHFHHVHARYADLQEETNGRVPALDYCELPPNKARMIRLFHSLTHEKTIEPPMPSPDVMRFSVLSWKAASGLYRATRAAVRIEREERRKRGWAEPPVIVSTMEELRLGRVFTYAISKGHFDKISGWLEELEKIPEDFWYFNPRGPLIDSMAEIGDIFNYHHRRHDRAICADSGWGERYLARQSRQTTSRSAMHQAA